MEMSDKNRMLTAYIRSRFYKEKSDAVDSA